CAYLIHVCSASRPVQRASGRVSRLGKHETACSILLIVMTCLEEAETGVLAVIAWCKRSVGAAVARTDRPTSRHAPRPRMACPHTRGRCRPHHYRCLLPLGDVRFWSALLTSSRSKASGSNAPPTQSIISSCSGCCGSWIAARKLAYPQIPPQSSG